MTAGSISAPFIIPLRVGHSQKFLIDTNTLIEIRSDTCDVDVYYTLDGSKPDAFITLSARRPTIQYKKPFYIPREKSTSGKVTIKAIAVSRDGIRESAVVTKTFDIKHVPSDHSPSDEHENRYLHELQHERKELMRQIHNENEQMQQNLSESMHHSSIDLFLRETPSRHTRSDSPKHTDVLCCAYCFAPKTNDLYARFCTECGLPWKKLTQNPPEKHSVKTCANCKSTIPINSHTCAVCERPPSSENHHHHHRANSQNQTTILCPHCKSANPVHLRACYICESLLMPSPTPHIRASVSVPSTSNLTNPMMKCSQCSRFHKFDARFCDWCGAQPNKVSIPIQCTKCRTNNDPHAKFGSSCGCVVEPSLRLIDGHLRNDSNIVASSMVASTLARRSASPTWMNANATSGYYQQPYSTRKDEAATQTYGIYYPSAKDVDLLITQNKKLLVDQEIKEHRPVLTAVSPGNGYWKQQLDHVTAHLKAYAVNRPDFQVLIGEPRLGKMVHATIHENEHQIIVQTVFSKPQNLSHPTLQLNERNRHYSMHSQPENPSHSTLHLNERDRPYSMNSERSSTLSSTFNSDDEYTREKHQHKKVKKRSKKRPESAVVTSSHSPKHALIELLERTASDYHKKSLHHIDVLHEVKHLLKEGADANAHNKIGFTVLQLAVRNGHHDCLETLIKDGNAKVSLKGLHGNTALHECCLLGLEGVEPLEILLNHGGDVSVTNDKKETVSDVASKQNCPQLLSVISSKYGQKLVDRQVKNYYDDHARTTTTNSHHPYRKT